MKELRSFHRNTPILFVEHADGYAPFYMDTARLNLYRNASILMKHIFNDLKKDGYKNIYLLTDKEIGFDINSTTEGLHPDDIGMMQYANVYEKFIRKILHEPIGSVPAEKSKGKYRNNYFKGKFYQVDFKKPL